MSSLPCPKRERFAQLRAQGTSQGKAYAEAGFADNDGNAWRMNSYDEIQDRIAELLNIGATQSFITVASLTEMLLEDRELAIKNDQPSSAVAAISAIAKLNGLIVDKTENTNKQVDNMTDADLADIARAGSARANKAKSSTKGSNPLH